MLQSATTHTATTQFTAAYKTATGYAKSLSVKIQCGGFISSGVVTAWTNGCVYLATARHNVDIATPGYERFDSKAKKFLQNAIFMVPGYDSTRAKVIGFPKAGAHSVRDVAAIMITDGPFCDEVKRRIEVWRGPISEYTEAFELCHNWEGADSFRALTGQEACVETNKPPVADEAAFTYVYEDRYHLFQTGFGRNIENSEYSAGSYQQRHLHCRHGVHSFLTKSHHIADEEGFEQLIILRASNTETTLPGDSGGPLLLIDTKGNDHEIRLLGVTTGSNYYADHIDNNAGNRNNASTAVTSTLLNALLDPGDDNMTLVG